MLDTPTERLSFAVSPSAAELIRQSARREGISLSVWINRRLASYFADEIDDLDTIDGMNVIAEADALDQIDGTGEESRTLADYLAEMDAEFGPFTPEEREEARLGLIAAGVRDDGSVPAGTPNTLGDDS